MKWTKEAALGELTILISEIEVLEKSDRMSAPHVRWIARVVNFLDSVFGPVSLYLGSFQALTWNHRGNLILQTYNFQAAIDRKNHEGYLRDLDTARGLLQAARDELERTEIADVYKANDSPEESSGLLKVISIAERKLRKVIRTPPAAEKEVTDAFESLLVGADIEFTRESENLVYSSKTYIPDFVITRLSLAIEIKLSAKTGREKEVIGEINDDILAYKTKYRNQLFVVYDTGFIRDVDRFAEAFETQEGVLVRVVKH